MEEERPGGRNVEIEEEKGGGLSDVGGISESDR
jgi:hypothetical protein